MEPSDLALSTTQELIEELMRRKTFLGVVVQLHEPFKERTWDGAGMFRLHYNSNLDLRQASHLLESVSRYVSQDPS